MDRSAEKTIDSLLEDIDRLYKAESGLSDLLSSEYLINQAKKCKTSQGAAILLALKGWIDGVEVIEGCQEAWQIADLYFIDKG